MISIKPSEMSERDNYKFLIGSIIPRPVAVVSSVSSEGVVNIAPFSYFNIVTSNPPIISLGIQRKNGVMKDTTRNILENKEAVVHIADEDNIEDINETAANLKHDESELDRTRWTLSPAEEIKVPLLNELKIKMEVSLYQHIPIDDEGSVTADLLLLRVEKYHIQENLYQDGRINPDLLKPMSRLAGNDYGKLGERVRIARPE
ncbi:flavin reductase family protein [Vagococcus hydrophili]|uniref:Flavin reductase family protein n=1 Tax=Vagococcus hydrophili TaxID=2714947 RepID=A0A6G8ASX6_9ENTE|nr:flavin reductase family protein [Vagococcus hydrophili]QIL48106.1 flavin reductase family protein [Vagococcus hydrophili]